MPAKAKSYSVDVDKIELVQVIQSAENDIPLIAGKRTYVRVFLDAASVEPGALLYGRINVSINGAQTVESRQCMDSIALRPGLSLEAQRLDWTQSLNFLLKEDEWEAFLDGKVEVELAGLTVRSTDGKTHAATVTGSNRKCAVEFVISPQMKCRIIAFKHRDRENIEFVQPTKGEADAIRRYVDCAFPVAKVGWSDLAVAAPRNFRAVGRVARESDRTHGQITRKYVDFFVQLLAIREQDIINGRDPKTLYLGLIADPSGRFGGAAMDSPQFTAPHVVALTTPDPEGQLGAHELAHVLGRRHPGIPSIAIHGSYIGQREEPCSTNIQVKFKNGTTRTATVNRSGFLSNPTGEPRGRVHHGLDNRLRGRTPELLPYDQWFDLMTYRHPKWVSNLTYLGLLQRLQEIDGLDVGVKAPIDPDGSFFNSGIDEQWSWTVIGEYDIRRKEGRIHYLAPGNYKTPVGDKLRENPTRDAIVQLGWRMNASETKKTESNGNNSNDEYAKVGVHVRNYRALDGSKSVGVFQHTLAAENLPSEYQASFKELVRGHRALKLFVNGVMVDEVRGCMEDEHGRSKKFDSIIKDIGACVNRDLDNRAPPNLRLGAGPTGGDKKGGLSLQYCVDDGGYYLRYRWRWNESDTRDLRVITTIACKRLRFGGTDECNDPRDEPQWQTVMVSDGLSGRVWISPVFLPKPIFSDPKGVIGDDDEYFGSSPAAGYGSGNIFKAPYSQYGIEGAAYYEPEVAKQQEVEVRIGITIGFRTQYLKPDNRKKKQESEFERPVSEIEAFGSRNRSNSHLPHPGGPEEPKGENAIKPAAEERDWYRDTGSEPEDVETESAP